MRRPILALNLGSIVDVNQLLPPANHPDCVEAFNAFSSWGAAEDFDGFDTPISDAFVMILCDEETFLVRYIAVEKAGQFMRG